MNKICPLCKGANKQKYLFKHKQTGSLITVVDWCLCMKSKLVSESPSLPILVGLGDTYLPIEQVDPQLILNLEDLKKSPNLLIMSETNYESFLLHIKSFIMQYKFMDPAPLIYACDSIDILKKFYVAQEDGACPSLAGVNKFDLLIFIMGADEKNDQLNTCVAQVVANRKNIGKPTWIYLKRPYDACIWEKSEVLKGYLDLNNDSQSNRGYAKINLKNVTERIEKRQSKAKKTAEKGIS